MFVQQPNKTALHQQTDNMEDKLRFEMETMLRRWECEERSWRMKHKLEKRTSFYEKFLDAFLRLSLANQFNPVQVPVALYELGVAASQADLYASHPVRLKIKELILGLLANNLPLVITLGDQLHELMMTDLDRFYDQI